MFGKVIKVTEGHKCLGHVRLRKGFALELSDKKPSAVMMLFQRKKTNTTPVCMPVKGMCV